MIVKIGIHRAKLVKFDEETGELILKCTNQGSKFQFPVSIHVAHGETEQDYRENKDLQSATLKVGQRGSMNLVDKERG